MTVTNPEPELKKQSDQTHAVDERTYLSAAAGVVLAALLLFALFRSGIFHSETLAHRASQKQTNIRKSASGDPDEGISGLSPLTTEIPDPTKQIDPKQIQSSAEAKAEAAAKDAAQDQQKLAAQKETADLKAQKAQLDAAAAAQAAAALELEKQRANLEASRIRAQQEEAERQRKVLEAEAAKLKAHPAYQGPTSGAITWEGVVEGTTMVTISGNESDSGRIVSGALPGVAVLLTPADTKHIRIASSPAPSNSFQRMVFGAIGNGPMQVTIHWSLP